MTRKFVWQVVTVAKFEGGHALNVIPESVTIGGTFRAYSGASFLQLKQRIDEVAVIPDTHLGFCGSSHQFITKLFSYCKSATLPKMSGCHSTSRREQMQRKRGFLGRQEAFLPCNNK